MKLRLCAGPKHEVKGLDGVELTGEQLKKINRCAGMNGRA